MPNLLGAVSVALPLATQSGTLAATSANQVLPTGIEYLLLSASAVMAFRIGVGAQTAVATDIQFGGAAGPLLIRVSPGLANNLAVFGTGTYNICPVNPV